MAPSTLLAAAGLIAAASGLNIQRSFPGAVSGAGFVSVPISAPTRNTVVLRKRDGPKGTSNIDIPNGQNSGYTVKISIGDPAQEVEVVIDTGSGELWVSPDCDQASRSDDEDVIAQDTKECSARGSYDPSKSNSSKDVSKDVEDDTLTYGDGTTASLEYFSDSITIGGLTIKDQIFGVAKESKGTDIGIMGFGPPPSGFNSTDPYPYVLATMASQGVINTPAYSLNLRDYDTDTGSLIFGGYDTKRFTGELTNIPFETLLIKYDSGGELNHTSNYLTVLSMQLTKPDATKKSYSTPKTDGRDGFAISLDSGSSFNILPAGLGEEICADLSGERDGDNGNCVVDCAVRTQSGGLRFELSGGKKITIPYSNLINQFGGPESNTIPTCIVANSDLDENLPAGILGMPFLRSAYAVFDWGRGGQLWIAQAADCGSDVKGISGKGEDGGLGGIKGECERPAFVSEEDEKDNAAGRRGVGMGVVMAAVAAVVVALF